MSSTISQFLLKGGLSRVVVTCAYAGCRFQASAIGMPTKLRLDPPKPNSGEDKCAETLQDHVRVAHRGVQ